ncbi:protein HOMOLOG OF MAMMALIAN LYST-INTERACTING PROTEIN 5 [Typha angustifolia]|uniref:protein HOMOLOG OF MAMMALIAN LYST-INTERACTING PROTEIN 5 n=1 Tax=Typha angustifolia TaxID=59011 RepID=UPI003C2D113B
MGSDVEPAKLLLPYLQRADELQKHEPLVAYYCRLYAMERGLRIPQKERTKTTNALLVSLMKQLEKDKKSLKLGPEDSLYIEGFASNVFAKADKQDRAGRADLNTAKTFYAASIFFEILNQFGELQPDIEQKQKYAVWKAADIRKALKEGRKPEPGPPGGDKDELPSTEDTYDLGPSQSLSTRQQGGDTSFQQPDKNLGSGQSFSTSQQSDDTSFQHLDKDLSRSVSLSASYPGDHSSPQQADRVNTHNPTPFLFSPSSYDYPSNDNHQLPPSNTPEVSAYQQPYHHQPNISEQQHMPQSYSPPEIPGPSYSYPNFQSYPSFHDSTFPAAPTHQPSYYHGPDVSYSTQPAPVSNYPPAVPYHSGNDAGNQVASSTPPSDLYKYDSNYQPSVEKIAEAHKAARFAVGALAFDDVAVAVDFLRRSLELLTNPSAEPH